MEKSGKENGFFQPSIRLPVPGCIYLAVQSEGLFFEEVVVVVFHQNIHIEHHIDIGIRIAIPLLRF